MSNTELAQNKVDGVLDHIAMCVQSMEPEQDNYQEQPDDDQYLDYSDVHDYGVDVNQDDESQDDESSAVAPAPMKASTQQQSKQQQFIKSGTKISDVAGHGVYCEACSNPFVVSTKFTGDCFLCHWCRERNLSRACLRIGTVNYKVWISNDTGCADSIIKHGALIVEPGVLDLPNGATVWFEQMSHNNNVAAFQLFKEYINTPRALVDVPNGKSSKGNGHQNRITLQEDTAEMDASTRGINIFVQFKVRLVIFTNRHGVTMHVPASYFPDE